MSSVQSNLELLAKRIVYDIRARGLKPGDRYLTADEAGQMLEVSTVTAHRAMKLLSDRRMLVRQRKAGTFIGEGAAIDGPAVRQKVHVIIASDVGRDQASALKFLSHDLLAGINDAMPGVSVQIDIVTQHDGMAFVRDTIERARSGQDFAGAILVRSTLAMQRAFQEAKLPVVVYGSPPVGIDALPHLDMDQAQIGERTADYVLRHGHRRVRLFMFDYWAPGDNRFVSALMGTLQAAAKPPTFDMVSLPPDEQVVAEVVREMLAAKPRPTALIARTAVIGRLVSDALNNNGPGHKDLELIVGNYHQFEHNGQCVPHAEALIDTRQRGRILGDMLRQQADGGAAHSQLIDVAFSA